MTTKISNPSVGVAKVIVDGTDALTIDDNTQEIDTNTFGLKSKSMEIDGRGVSPFTSFKNKIIGGDFSKNPWYRGTSFTPAANGGYTADRWRVDYSTTAVVDVLKTADAPTAEQAGVYTQHCLHADITTADTSITAGDFYIIQQKIEGLNIIELGFGQSGTRYAVVSFWHKITKTGTHCVSLANAAGNRSQVKEFTQSVSDEWEFTVLLFDVDTTGTWLYDNSHGVALVFCLAAGSNWKTTPDTWQAGQFFATSNQVNNLDLDTNNFKIALVQLEQGQNATAFDVLDVEKVESLCARYLPVFEFDPSGGVNQDIGTVNWETTTQCTLHFDFKVKTRVPPTGLVNQLTTPTAFGNNNAYSLSSLVLGSASTQRTSISSTSTTSIAGTAGRWSAQGGRILFTGAEL